MRYLTILILSFACASSNAQTTIKQFKQGEYAIIAFERPTMTIKGFPISADWLGYDVEIREAGGVWFPIDKWTNFKTPLDSVFFAKNTESMLVGFYQQRVRSVIEPQEIIGVIDDTVRIAFGRSNWIESDIYEVISNDSLIVIPQPEPTQPDTVILYPADIERVIIIKSK